MGGIGFGQCVGEKKDCFAYVCGRCGALVDGDFGNRECPFYKPKTTNTDKDTQEVKSHD